MLELLPKSVTSKLNSPVWVTTHRRDWSSDSSGSSLLSPIETPWRRGHRRQLGFARTKTSRAICTAAAIALLTVVLLWWTFSPTSDDFPLELLEPDIEDGNAADPNGPIPAGKSVERNGREVFWWEEFPRLDLFTAPAQRNDRY